MGLAVPLRVEKLLLETVLDTEGVIDVVIVKEGSIEAVNDVLTVPDGEELIDGLPLGD